MVLCSIVSSWYLFAAVFRSQIICDHDYWLARCSVVLTQIPLLIFTDRKGEEGMMGNSCCQPAVNIIIIIIVIIINIIKVITIIITSLITN